MLLIHRANQQIVGGMSAFDLIIQKSKKDPFKIKILGVDMWTC